MQATLEPAAAPTENSSANDSVADLLEQKAARGEIKLSEMGKRLLAARREVERSGIPLLTREELDREHAERRGECDF